MGSRASVRVAALTALGLSILGGALAGVQYIGVGETRPVRGYAHQKHAKAQGLEVQSSIPKVLSYVPTYHEHVRPIFEKNCVGCHTQGGIAPFSLERPEDAFKQAQTVKNAVQTKRMPPFLPDGESPAFRDDLRLSDDEIAIIANWVWAGSPMGKLEKAAPLPPRVVKPPFDLTVDIGRDFQPQSDYSDEYRCFLIDPKLEKPAWLSGYDVIPGNRAIVHHVVAYQVTGQFVKEARELEAKQDGRGGWTCYGGPNVGTGALRDVAIQAALSGETTTTAGNIEVPGGLLGYVGSWVPGGSSVRFPEGTGVELRAGAQLLVQVHYNLLAGNGKDRTAVSFDFHKGDAKLKPLSLMGLAAPVEIPCPGVYPSDSSDPCHREAAYKVVERYQETWLTGILKSGLVASYCQQQLPTQGSSTGRLTTTCDFPVSKPQIALGTQGHMHTRGLAVKIEVNPGTPKRIVALDIPRYDFNWQSSYFFKNPIKLEKGDKVRISCTFDNTQTMQPWENGKQAAPKYIVWGESTTDEMCVGYLQTVIQQ